jgi:hypothetical protein
MTTKALLAELSVEFGTISITDTKARIACKLYRLDLDELHQCPKCRGVRLDHLLLHKRLTATLEGQPRGIGHNGRPLPGINDLLHIDWVWDSKGYSSQEEHISFSLSAQLEGLEVETLALFAKRTGKIAITSVEEMPEDPDE